MIIKILPVDPKDQRAVALLQQSRALMEDLFPPEENHFLSIDALSAPNIHFFAAQNDQDAWLGCAALAHMGAYGEIKSMFVDPSARSFGIGHILLNHLERKAYDLNLTRLMLETGQALEAAIRLYQRHGFIFCPPFGDYVENSTSVFMQKEL